MGRVGKGLKAWLKEAEEEGLEAQGQGRVGRNWKPSQGSRTGSLSLGEQAQGDRKLGLGGQWVERLDVQVERGGTLLSKRPGYLSKKSQEDSIKSAPDLLLWYHGSSSFVLLRGTMVVVVNPLDVCTDSILQFWFFFCLFGLAGIMQFLVISHQIVHASVVRILICRGYREFFLVFFQISFFNQFFLCSLYSHKFS